MLLCPNDSRFKSYNICILIEPTPNSLPAACTYYQSRCLHQHVPTPSAPACSLHLVVLGVDDRLANHVGLQTVEAVEHGPEVLRHRLAELGGGGVVEAVLEEVARAVGVAGGGRAVAAVEGAALDLEVVLADVDWTCQRGSHFAYSRMLLL